MALASMATANFLIGLTRESVPLKLKDANPELGICIFELVGSSVKFLLELLVSTSKLADHLLYVEEAGVSDLASEIIC